MNIGKRRALSILLAGVMAIAPVSVARVEAADVFESSIADFPESYKPYLRELHKKYPAWKFKAYKTGIDFATAVKNEQSNSRSVMEKSYNDLLKSRGKGDYNASTKSYIIKDGSSWVSASCNTVAYFMDPRNFLNEDFIAMFESLSYNPSEQTQGGVEAILKGSFMYNTTIAWFNSKGVYKSTKGADYLYSKRILDAASESGVSPYFLASKMVLEVGKASYNAAQYPGVGAGSSVNGMYPGYKGIFNFYNIGATDGTGAVARGLAWASTSTANDKYKRPWTSPAKSIIGGAIYIGEKYISAGQNTTYFQRFNVKSDIAYSPYTHQYMTSIYGNAAESNSTMNAYKSNAIMDTDKTFIIPVYNNMPGDDTKVIYGDESKTGVASANVVLRKKASTSSDMVLKLTSKDKLTIIEGVMTNEEYGVKWLNNPYWFKVKLTKDNKTYTGYVSANYVDVDSEKNIIKGVPAEIDTEADSETVFYESDDPSVVTVDEKGVVTGVKTGTATVRAYAASGSFSAVTVNVVDKGVQLNKSSLTISREGKKTLKATVYPENSKNTQVTWTSDNEKVATVSSSGKVKGISVGKTTIHCVPANGGEEAVCKVKVIEPVTDVELDKESYKITVGKKVTANYKITPDNATDKSVKWSVDNEKTATVSKGVITAVSPGTATLTVTSKNRGLTDTATITVNPRKPSVKVTTKSADSLKVSWSKVDEATAYKLYKKRNDKWAVVKTLKSDTLSYTCTGLKTGNTYEYTVCAVAKVDGKKYYSDKAASVSKMVIPSKPKIKEVSPYKEKTAKITWKSVKGIDGYEVYRRIGTDGNYKLIKTIEDPESITYNNSGLKKETTYYYKIRAYKKTKTETVYSKYSKTVSFTR